MGKTKHHIVYRTVNIITGKYYIGIHTTTNLDDKYLGSGVRLYYSINKYGVENFVREVIKECSSRKEAFELEAKLVGKAQIKDENCLNIVLGGTGLGYGKHHPSYGTSHSAKRKKQISEFFVEWHKNNDHPTGGKPLSFEHKRKLSIMFSGKTNPMYGKTRSHSEETKEKMRGLRPHTSGENNGMFGRHHSEETKEKMRGDRPTLYGENNGMYNINPDEHPRSVRCRHIESGEEFDSMESAGKAYGISGESVGMHCRGNRKLKLFEYA